MLRFDISDIIRTVGMHRSYDIAEAPFTDEDVEYVAPITGSVAVTNSGRILLVRGNIKTVIAAECARCLADLREPIDAAIEEQYTLGEVQNGAYNDITPAVVQDEENEVPLGLFDGTVINLGVLIRQAAILNATINPLCREDCAGLCPKCGKNRNESTCRCGESAGTKPFAALAELLKQEPPQN